MQANVWITSEAFALFSGESYANFTIKDKSDLDDMLTYIDSKITYYDSPLRDQSALAAYYYPTGDCEYCWNPYDDDTSYVVNDIQNPIISPPVCVSCTKDYDYYSSGVDYCYSNYNST